MEPVTGWRKASYSGTNGGNCVEAGNTGRGVAVRDSKDQDGPRLAVTPVQWRAMTRRLQRGR
jgi:uncharacterized protein DUF397